MSFGDFFCRPEFGALFRELSGGELKSGTSFPCQQPALCRQRHPVAVSAVETTLNRRADRRCPQLPFPF